MGVRLSEIASQVLTGLFCVTSLLPLPWRLVDLWHISVIYSYARTTYKRRRRLALPPLRDPNDLPDPVDAEVSSNREMLSRLRLRKLIIVALAVLDRPWR